MAGFAMDRHLDWEAAERYSMSLLSTWKAAQIEEHLLICEACRRSAAAADAYIAAMRMAAKALE
jgi:predicted anti-sigma-YlaC factor YlaD